MESLFIGNSVILLFWVCITFIIEVKEKTKKIILMYLITYITNVLDIVPTGQSYIILLLALFLEMEFWGDKFKVQIINNVFEKILDFVYIMGSQYGIISFSLALFLSSSWWMERFNDDVQIAMQIISCIIVYISCKNAAREKFKVYTFTQIKEKIDNIKKYRRFINEKSFIDNPECVLVIEDRSFYLRGDNKYTFLNRHYCGARYLKKLLRIIKKFFSSKNKTISMKRFLRGYSTIEMQLLRTLAIQEGYTNCILRRKAYEVLYARLFLKNLKKYYKECECDVTHFKDFMLYLYMRVAPCLNKGEESRLTKVIKKERTAIDTYTREELFILTLCFSGKIKRDYVLEMYQEAIYECGLDMEKLKDLAYKLNC